MVKLASEEIGEALDRGEQFPSEGDVIESKKLIFEGPKEWIVTHIEMSGGQSGTTPIDYKPDGFHVTAQQLNSNGTYNQKGFIHKFYMSGNFANKIEPKEIKITRRMKKTYI